MRYDRLLWRSAAILTLATEDRSQRYTTTEHRSADHIYVCVCDSARLAKKKLLLVKGIVVEIKIKANYLFRPMAQTRFGIFLGI